MITEKQFDKALAVVKAYRSQLLSEVAEINAILEGDIALQNCTIYNSGLSLRCLNILKSYYEDLNSNEFRKLKVKELSKLSMMHLSKQRNCGIKTLDEIKDLCEKAGIQPHL